MTINLVLVSPKYSGNVGACARVATNFDVSDISVVAPQCDYLNQEAQLYGKGPARDRLFQIKKFETLDEALNDCTIAVAFTRRFGNWSPEEVSFHKIPQLQSGNQKVALVFGREDQCLLSDELRLCTHFCTIPTSDTMPTMNLSHSVAVVLAKLYSESCTKSLSNDNVADEGVVSVQEFNELMEHFGQTMVDAGITRAGNPERMRGRMSRALQRAHLTKREVGIFRGFLSKVQVAMGTRKRKVS